ncbi:putative aldo/keto reductase [Cadophora sp. DSE1049]|nr:putative aldo/keto reductase [Cadophora sp. DSE1049]
MPPTLIFGAGGIGSGKISHTWTNAEQTTTLLATLQSLNLTELDSGAGYPPGAPWVTERLLGETKAAEGGFVIDTKILPRGDEGRGKTRDGSLSERGIEWSLGESLRLLGVEKVNILYAHAPDPSTSAEETARAFDKQFRAGKFKKLGLSNYSTAQMAEYLAICGQKGYIKPTYYQGHYNILTRQGEESLFPLLRAHNIIIMAYGPLAGGFLTGKVSLPPPSPETTKDQILKGGRFEQDNFPIYKETFDKEGLHEAMRRFVRRCEEKGVSATEVSLRWIIWHGALGEGDGVILGATKEDQLRGNVEFCRKGKLDDELVEACEELWREGKGLLGDEWF